MRAWIWLAMAALALPPTLDRAAAGVCDEDCRPTVQKLSKRCYFISATMDGGPGKHSIDRSRQALKETIADFRRRQPPEEGWMGRVSIVGMRPKPNPYMRDSVPRNLTLPGGSTRGASTVCWRGVIAPAVCTSGAKVCR